MKKVLFILLISALFLGYSSCLKSKTNSNKQETTPKTNNTDEKFNLDLSDESLDKSDNEIIGETILEELEKKKKEETKIEVFK